MAPLKGKKSALQRLAEEGSRTAKDFDPEDLGDGRANDTESEDSDVSDPDARSHYEHLGKSKLRKVQGEDLGPQYAGAAVSRDILGQSESDEEGDESGPEGFSDDEEGGIDELNGLDDSEDDEDEHGAGLSDLEDGLSSEDDDEGEDDDDDEDISGSEDDQGPAQSKRSKQSQSSSTAALAALAQQNQEATRQTLVQAAQADVEKGQAVKKQRATFNALLNARMRLQKGLVASNTLSTVPSTSISSPSDRDVIQSAEAAALSLFNSISALRQSLSLSSASGTGSERTGTKRPFSATLETPSSQLHGHLQSLEASQSAHRRTILTRWAQKTQPSAALAKTSKLREAPAQQPFVSMLESQLVASNVNRLVERSRMPRSCAPVQAERSKEADASVYDDADWYALLLRDLVEAKMGESGTGAGGDAAGMNGNMPTAASVDALRRQAKTHRANVDVKASKGRKLRYTVQEKIQNFMAPEDRTTWDDRQITELFGSLLGKRVAGGLGEEDGEDVSADETTVAEPLRLFAGQ